MADKPRFLDVWIVEGNTVYQEVPYTVVLDWIQQGRLLEDDMIRPSGTREWLRLGGAREFQPFFPHAEPTRPEDQAEALEHVELDIHYKKHPEEEDDDVDMIPLIDVSLVLLVFFMLTASAAAISTTVRTPETDYGMMAENPGAMRIDIRKDDEGQIFYSLGMSNEPPGPEVPTLSGLLTQLKSRLEVTEGTVELVINADKDLKARVVRDVLLALRGEPFRSKITVNYFGVSEREP